MKKILFLCPKINLDRPSGGTLHYLDLTECMARSHPDYDIVLVASGKKKTEKRKNLTIISMPGIDTSIFRQKNRKETIQKLNEIIQGINPDFIYYRTEPFESFPIYIDSSKPKIIEIGYNLFAKPYDIPRHISLLWTLRNLLLYIWLKKCVKNFDCVLVQSQSSRKSLEKRIRGKSIVVVKDAAYAKKFKQSKTAGNKVRIVFVGNELKYQGASILVEAQKHINKNLQNYEIIVIGKYSREMFPDSEKTRFLGFMPNEKVVKILANCDVGVAPYMEAKNEPYGFSPIKIFEYMAAGLAIVATDTEWDREIIKDYENGLLFRANDARHLASRLEELIKNRKLLQKLKASSRRSSPNNDWSRRSKDIINIFKSIRHS